MEFKLFRDQLVKNFLEVTKDVDRIFEVDINKDILWETYLNSFPEGTNEIYLKRREHDCSCCRQFIKNFGSVVWINKFYEVLTIWDFKTEDQFIPVVKAMKSFVKSHLINNVFLTKERKIGVEHNFQKTESGPIKRWEHFYVELPKKFTVASSKTIDTLKNDYRTTREVFERSLKEISQEAVQITIELSLQKSLYKGEEWLPALEKFLSLHEEYSRLSDAHKNNFCWVKSFEVGPVVGRIKNHSIGTFLVDITNGVDIEVALRKYEKVVAPTNYKRPNAVYTKKMLEDAKRVLESEGLFPSLERRFANITDIPNNDLLFANRTTISKIIKDPFFELEKDVKTSTKTFDKLEEVYIEEFIKNILPKTNKLEVFVENKHRSNLVSLIAPVNRESKPLFKWDNGVTWSYTGNITDSMKERVKTMGGRVDGVLRFSIQWNDNLDNESDLDAHCIEPNGNEIYFARKKSTHSLGNLDVDIINPSKRVAVENITFPLKHKMLEGKYTFYVHNYTNRFGKSGFSAEIEYDGVIRSYVHDKSLRQNEKVVVAEILFNQKTGIQFLRELPSTESTKTMWELKTNNFYPVSMMLLSPNYWGENSVGNKHYLFMVDDCRSDETPNGFYNEFIKEDYMKHRKVFEALGSRMKVEKSESQVSGLGFSSTQKNSIVCKVSGSFSRMLKINF